jgi:hypothetical protein
MSSLIHKFNVSGGSRGFVGWTPAPRQGDRGGIEESVLGLVVVLDSYATGGIAWPGVVGLPAERCAIPLVLVSRFAMADGRGRAGVSSRSEERSSWAQMRRLAF